jgi:putative FmdB family regulatory protein
MPLYEYVCEECQNPFEALVYAGEEAECPHCHGRQLHRNLSLPAAPQTSSTSLPMGGCGDPSLPPCGAPGCRRGKM